MTNGQDMAAMAGLYKKIHAVMSEMEHVEKRGHNDFHRYDYVMAADVIEAARELMAKHGLVLLPSVTGVDYVAMESANGKTDHRARVHLLYRLCDIESGASVELPFDGEGQDAGDKAVYKAYTGALKYFLVNTFQIPTGDDPEDDGGQAKPKQPAQQQRPQQASQPRQTNGAGQPAATPTPNPGPCKECGAAQKWSVNKSRWYCGDMCWQQKPATAERG